MLPAADVEATLPAGLCTASVVPGRADRNGSCDNDAAAKAAGVGITCWCSWGPAICVLANGSQDSAEFCKSIPELSNPIRSLTFATICMCVVIVVDVVNADMGPFLRGASESCRNWCLAGKHGWEVFEKQVDFSFCRKAERKAA